MRILQILLFPLHGSGSGSYADRLADFEQARGHTVRVLCCDHAVPQRPYETAALIFKAHTMSATEDRASGATAEPRPTSTMEVASTPMGANLPQGRLPDDVNLDLDFNFPAFTTHPLSTSTTFGSLSDEQRAEYMTAFQHKIRTEVAAFKPDIVHAHHGWVIGATLADLGVPYVISLHGTEHYGFRHYPAYREWALKGLRGADRV